MDYKIISSLIIAGISAFVYYISLKTENDSGEYFAMTLEKCSEKTAFVVGYTGEVGKELVRELLEKKIFKKVVLIGRRQVHYDDPLYANAEQKIVDFEHLENHKNAFQDIEYGFCCLGTTRKAAGAEGFFKVDHDYVVDTAKVAHETGCKRFSIVTAANANKDSYFLYPQTKGLVEQHVSEIPFEKLTIARPGFITHRTEPRFVEKLALFSLKPITWLKPTILTVPTTKIAKAMIYKMCSEGNEDKKIEILNNQNLHEISDNFYDKLFPSNKSQ